MAHVVVLWETLLGKASEHEIQHRLDYFSHTQKLENDVGIDFYCNLIENRVPTHEFYVQAKNILRIIGVQVSRNQQLNIGWKNQILFFL